MSEDEIVFRSDFTVDLVDVRASDDMVLKSMLVSTLNDDTVLGMEFDAAEGRINYLMKNRHGTPFEHNMFVFRVEAPIFVYREWHRHRVGISINEQSGRYTKFEPVFYIPPPHRPLQQVGKPGAYEYVEGSDELYVLFTSEMKRAARFQWVTYEDALEAGVAKEVARMHLGVNIYSSMYWTCNARSLMAFLSLRTNEPDSLFPSKPMWEIDQCARKLESFFAQEMPITHAAFDRHKRVCP